MASTKTWEEHLKETTVLPREENPVEVEFGAGSFPDFVVDESEGAKVTMTEVGKYPEFVLGELAETPMHGTLGVESTAFGRYIGVLRAQARAAGLTEAEVEKISTCPLVRLLVRQE